MLTFSTISNKNIRGFCSASLRTVSLSSAVTLVRGPWSWLRFSYSSRFPGNSLCHANTRVYKRAFSSNCARNRSEISVRYTLSQTENLITILRSADTCTSASLIVSGSFPKGGSPEGGLLPCSFSRGFTYSWFFPRSACLENWIRMPFRHDDNWTCGEFDPWFRFPYNELAVDLFLRDLSSELKFGCFCLTFLSFIHVMALVFPGKIIWPCLIRNVLCGPTK